MAEIFSVSLDTTTFPIRLQDGVLLSELPPPPAHPTVPDEVSFFTSFGREGNVGILKRISLRAGYTHVHHFQLLLQFEI